MTRTGRVIMVLLLAFGLSGSLLAESVRMYAGDMRVLNLGHITRVAVGNGKLLSTSILENGELLVLAEKEGDTELKVWTDGNRVTTYKIYITKQDSTRTASEAAQSLKNLPGISIRQVGKNTVVEGYVTEQTAELIDKVAGKYPDLINLTRKSSIAELAEVLQALPGVKVRRIGKYAVVEGAVNAVGKKLIEAAKSAFPDLLDLTQEAMLKSEPMVYMEVQITEFSTNALQELGIDWTTSFNGPSAGFAKDFSQDGDPNASVLGNSTNPLTGLVATDASSAIGYFGIATLITSQIKLAVSNGDALILAQPTLSARSGGKAEFLSGGQFPVPVPGPNQTTTIEFKDYGIRLKIEPRAGITGNVLAKVEAEVSAIDKSVAVGNTPGTKSRKTATEVSLRDGQTLVISGLVNHDVGKDVTKFKWLGDLPILGALFRSTSFRNNHSDLVIFITPHIVDADSPLNKRRVAHADELRARFLKAVDEGQDILE